jgi:hypothetical protein
MPGPVSDSYEPPDNHTVYCAFCGHEYPPGTPTSKAKALAEHIKVCDRHPVGIELRRATKKLKDIREFVNQAIDAIDETPMSCQDEGDMGMLTAYKRVLRILDE